MKYFFSQKYVKFYQLFHLIPPFYEFNKSVAHAYPFVDPFHECLKCKINNKFCSSLQILDIQKNKVLEALGRRVGGWLLFYFPFILTID